MSERLRLWAGPECTVNRVGDRYFDQLEATGFARRLEDIDRLASLGIECVRFPLLWERMAPRWPEAPDWAWADVRLHRLRELGVRPILGLVHHGSGPPCTDLLDPLFPEKLASYAALVAERYPWVDAYTPVNEPLTTARFAGLYGLWHPHRADDRSFVRALLSQVRATVLAMREVRRVNPRAALVQTDDLGCTRSTPPLAYQASFDNARRWLAFDLLFGRVDRRHPLWDYLVACGARPQELLGLVERPCPPDIVGLNSYVTSERFLDHRLSHYPAHVHGGNHRERYADTEAARVCGTPIGGFAARLREAHQRYRCPLAITEVHMGCTREEQLRWLRDAWEAAQQARREGVDVRALTAWAAFGACDWDSLLTRSQGHYEPGLWDVRAPEPRLTALGRAARELGHEGRLPPLPVLEGPGWWQREVRLVYPVHGTPEHLAVRGRPLLITGATGTLGRAFARLCHLRGLPFRLLSREDMDIADAVSVRAALEQWQPWALVNTAGYVRVDDAEADERQWRENALGPAVLAGECAKAGVQLLTFSSDLVFGGERSRPYEEHHAASPLNAYGRAKLAAEREVLLASPQALVVRTAAFFSPWDLHNFVTQGLQRLQRDEPWEAVQDQVVSPTYVPDLVDRALDLLIDGEQGLWHLTNDGAVSWVEFACRAAEAAGLRTDRVQARPGAAIGQRAPRPGFSALRSARAQLMPSLDTAIERYVQAWRAPG